MEHFRTPLTEGEVLVHRTTNRFSLRILVHAVNEKDLIKFSYLHAPAMEQVQP